MGMFDGIVSAATGGILDLAGGLFANSAQAQQAAQANAFSAQQTDKQMQFQKEMRATQYQTAVDDLQKAGLNPMLAYSQGGAGTPAGAAAVGQQATIQNPTKGLASSAAALGMLKADIENKDASTTEIISRTGVNDEMRKKLDADTKLTILQSSKVPYEIKNLISQSLLNDARTTATNAEEAATRLLLPKNAAEGKYYQTFGYGPFALRDLGQAAGSAANVFNKLTGK